MSFAPGDTWRGPRGADDADADGAAVEPNQQRYEGIRGLGGKNEEFIPPTWGESPVPISIERVDLCEV